MPFDSLVLAAITAEVREKLEGERLQAVHQPDRLTLVLTFSQKQRLLLSADPEHARAHLLGRDLPRAPQPPSFCMLLRKHLEGARLQSVRQVDFDRVIHLEFRHGEEVFFLIAELMGRHSNLFLLGADGVIRGLAKTVPPSRNRVRDLRSGHAYAPPPASGRVNPLEGPLTAALTALADQGRDLPMEEALARSWIGMSPLLVRWLLRTARLSTGDHCAGPVLEQLGPALEQLRQIISSSAFQPFILEGDPGGKGDFWALPFPEPPGEGSSIQSYRSMSAAVERIVRERLRARELQTVRSQALAKLNRAIAGEQHKLQDFTRAVEDGSHAAQWRSWGGALLAFPSEVPPSATLVRLPSPEDGASVEIPLDPQETALENAERYFRRARHAARAAEQGERRAPEAREKLDRLVQLRQDLEAAPSLQSLQEVLQRTQDGAGLQPAGTLPAPEGQGAVPPRKSKEPDLPPGIRRVIAASGHEILYGRSSTDNDYLTTRIARPNDLWLHARGDSSAHVVIRTNNQPDRVPRETLLQAANLAAIASPARHSSYVPVDYTLKKHVVKRRGSSPGMVEYRGEKTLHVQPRLQGAGE